MSNNTERLDALSVREDKQGKAWFSRIGVAWPSKDGLGYTVMLDAMPASTDGQYKIILTVPKPKEDKPQGGYSCGGRRADPDSGDIPFIVEYR